MLAGTQVIVDHVNKVNTLEMANQQDRRNGAPDNLVEQSLGFNGRCKILFCIRHYYTGCFLYR